jgi:outer membrane immunogenic protein
MRKIVSLCALAGFAAVATPAFAQDVAPDAPTESATSFRGLRIEGDAGGDRFQSQGVHRDKFGYGATVGFDGQIGKRIVIGPEATYWRANNYSQNCTGTVGGGSLCNRSFEEFGVGVRAGYLVTPQMMVFGKGGYVTNEQRKLFEAPAGQSSFYDHYNTDGYQVGGGVELSMADRFKGPLSGLYVNAQYVYSNYSDHTSRQRVMGGVGIRFK